MSELFWALPLILVISPPEVPGNPGGWHTMHGELQLSA